MPPSKIGPFVPNYPVARRSEMTNLDEIETEIFWVIGVKVGADRGRHF